MAIDLDEQLQKEWRQEKKQLRHRLNHWVFLLTIFLYPGTIVDYSAVKPEETTLFIWIRLLPTIITLAAWLTVRACKLPNQIVLYISIICVLTTSTYRPTPLDMGNFVFVNACCLILISAIPLIGQRTSLVLLAYLVVVNVGVYIIFYADTVPLPKSGLVFTITLGIMFVVVSKFRYEIVRRNFIQSKQLGIQNTISERQAF